MLKGTSRLRKYSIEDYMNEDHPDNIAESIDSVFIAGCGYLGLALAKELREKRVAVGALTRNVAQAARLRQLGLREVVVADLDNRDWHAMLRHDYKAVVNCVSSAGGGLAGYQKSYVGGQESILEWAQIAQPKLICYTSSTSVYPDCEGHWIDETATIDPQTDTASILYQAEEILLDRGCYAGEAVVLRLAGIYGPGRHYLIDQVKEGAPVLPGNGQHHMNLIHRDDAVSAIMAVIKSYSAIASGIYNVCDGQPFKQGEIVKWIAKSLRVNCPSFDPTLKPRSARRSSGKAPDRKISCKKLNAATSWQPAYSDFKSGYTALL